LTPFIGLVALPSAQDLLLCAKHLFVAAMVAWVHPGPAGNRQKSEHDESFRGGKRRRHYPWLPAVHWHIDFLVALPSAQDLLLCAKHLFVAAMVAWVHPGPAAYRQIRT
jgi:hypothetical protein